jgi:hypothetical protein
MYTHLSKWDQAITFHVAELSIQQTEFGAEAVGVADTLVTLADVYLRANKPKEAYEAASRCVLVVVWWRSRSHSACVAAFCSHLA